MKFEVTNARPNVKKERQGAKYFDIVTMLLETYEQHGDAKAVELTLEEGEYVDSTCGGISQHLYTRTSGTHARPKGIAHLHRRKVGARKYQLWIEYPQPLPLRPVRSAS